MARNNKIKSANIDQFYKDSQLVEKNSLSFLWNCLITICQRDTAQQKDILSDQKRVTTIKSLPFKLLQSKHTMKNKNSKI